MNTMQTPPAEDISAEIAALEARAASGAGWFFWIAGLSLVNTIAALLQFNWSFVVGLWSTKIFDYFADASSGSAKAIALVIGLVILGLYVTFGIFAKRWQTWAFAVGFVFYALDTVLLLVIAGSAGVYGEVVIDILFHAWALFAIGGGLGANIKANKLKVEQARHAYLTGQQSQPPYYQPPTDPNNSGGIM